MPHRLLQKRLLMPTKQSDGYYTGRAGDIPDCLYEWLVKWRGLGYEHATWELENASFLNSSEAQSLIREYENRRRKARSASDPSITDKVPPITSLTKKFIYEHIYILIHHFFFNFTKCVC